MNATSGNELIHLNRKLRWTGLDDETPRMEAKSVLARDP
jgi:hypothetical protein